MKGKMKKRVAVVSGVIAVVIIVVLAIVAGGSAARTVTVAQAASGQFAGEKVQVSGNVVTGSFVLSTDGVIFELYDPAADSSGAVRVPVLYTGAVSSTFGNEVTAIVTGRLDENGTLQATELVTKCPSKYESGTDALTVAQLVGYGSQVEDKTVKVAGALVAGSLGLPGGEVRFALADAGSATPRLRVHFDGALPDAVTDGANLVVTGSMTADGIFNATDVSLEA